MISHEKETKQRVWESRDCNHEIVSWFNLVECMQNVSMISRHNGLLPISIQTLYMFW